MTFWTSIALIPSAELSKAQPKRALESCEATLDELELLLENSHPLNSSYERGMNESKATSIAVIEHISEG